MTPSELSTLILQGHPDPAGGRLCPAMAAAYARGAEAAGHRVEMIDVAMLDPPLLRSQADFEDGQPPACIVPAQAAIRRASHLVIRSEEHTSELQSLMRISYAVFCLKKKKHKPTTSSQRNKETTQTKQN